MRCAMTAPVVDRSTKRRTRLPSITPLRAGRDREYDIRRRQARHDGLRGVGDFGRRTRRNRAKRREIADRFLARVVDDDTMAGLDKSARHVRAHVAETDEADVHHTLPGSFRVHGRRHEFRPHLHGMLAERRHGTVMGRRGSAPRRWRRIRHRTARRADRNAPQMRMAREAATSLTRAKAISASVSFCISVSASSTLEDGGNSAIRLGAALHAGEVGCEAGIGGEISVAQDLFGQHAPFAVILHGYQNAHTVACREHAVGRDGGMSEPDTLRRLAGFMLHKRNRHPVGHGVEHRNRKLGAFAGSLPCDQCLQDRLIRVHSGRDIDHRYANARRLRCAGDRGQADFRLNQQIVGLARCARPVSPKPEIEQQMSRG